MKISKRQFVFRFVVCALVFTSGTRLLLNQLPQSLFGSELFQTEWQHVASLVLSPIKIVLAGPITLLLQDPDPPPPFVVVGLVLYWTILALAIRYLIGKTNKTSSELR